MAELTWDDVGSREYETGVDHGVLYIPNEAGVYDDGVPWNGLITVTEKPGGATATPLFADNIKYLNLRAAETFAATIEAFMYPDEFAQFDGLSTPVPGVRVGQQGRGTFGLSYRTKIGNDVDGEDHGEKIHLVYGLTAAPSEKAYSTVNETPSAINFSWDVDSVPVAVTDLKPTSLITVSSTEVSEEDFAALEAILYGGVATDPRLPTPDEVISLITGSTEVTTIAPTYDNVADEITIPTVTGVEYLIDGVVVTGDVPITETTVVTARPAAGYYFSETSDDDWTFIFS